MQENRPQSHESYGQETSCFRMEVMEATASSKRHFIADSWLKKVRWKNIPWTLDMDVSENSGTPKSSISIGFAIINHPFWGTPNFWKHPYPLRSKQIKISFTPSPLYLLWEARASLAEEVEQLNEILKPKKNGPYLEHLRFAKWMVKGAH